MVALENLFVFDFVATDAWLPSKSIFATLQASEDDNIIDHDLPPSNKIKGFRQMGYGKKLSYFFYELYTFPLNRVDDMAPLPFWSLVHHMFFLGAQSWAALSHRQRRVVIIMLEFMDCYRYCLDFWNAQLPEQEQIPTLSFGYLRRIVYSLSFDFQGQADIMVSIEECAQHLDRAAESAFFHNSGVVTARYRKAGKASSTPFPKVCSVAEL
eukprot:5955772-Karenia_brevis.AAC.1